MADKRGEVDKWLAFVQRYCRKYAAAERIKRYETWAQQRLEAQEDENLRWVLTHAQEAANALEDGDIDRLLQAFERMVRYSMRVESGPEEEKQGE